MACTREELTYPRAAKGMDDAVLTFEEANTAPSQRSYTGVRIREFDDGNVNPEPFKQEEEEAEHLWEEFLSPTKIKSLAGARNLEDITCLEMTVNTRENSLGNFGSMLPNLTQLKLSNSVIATVRDLGTSLTKLRMLWMCRCCLSDLDGISSISSLVELYLAFNDISDVSPVSMLDNLEVLDLEGNLVEDLAQVEFLTLCSSLKSLNLIGNPVCGEPHPNSTEEDIASYDYRKAIHKAVPSLKFLDDQPFLMEKVNGKAVLRDLPKSAKGVHVPNHLIEDLQIISEGIKSVDSDESDTGSRPNSGSRASGRPGSARPGSAMARQRPSSAARQRPGSAMGQRPGSSAAQRPGTAAGQRPRTARATSSSEVEPTAMFQTDDSSDLTYGSSEVICGNISKALKARRKNLQNFKPNLAFTEHSPIHVPEKSYDDEPTDSASKEDVFEELRSWREEYSKMLAAEETETAQDRTADAPNSVSPSPPTKTSTERPASPTSPRSHYTPSPPSSSHERHRPSHLRRSLPNPPLVGRDIGRPSTAAEFRVRRFRHMSTEDTVENLKMRTLHGDECFSEEKNNSTPSLANRLSSALALEPESEPRSSSAPVKALRPQYRVLPNTPGTQDATQTNPPRSESPLSSDQELLYFQRPGTAAAALQKRRLRPNNPL